MPLEEVEEKIQKNLHLIDPDSLLSEKNIKSCASTILEKGWQVSSNLDQIKSVVSKLIKISFPAAKPIKNNILMSWIKNIATFDSLKGNNIESHLNMLVFIFEIEEPIDKRYESISQTSWEVFTAKLKLKYSGQLSQDIAREEVKNFKIDESNFRADAEVLYKIYRTAYPNRDEIEIIEKAQELLARNHRVWDHIRRNMSCYSDFMEMVTSVDAFLKSEIERVNIVGRVDNRKTMMQCNFCKLKGHKENECKKKAGNCFARGSSGHRMKECSKRGDSSLVKKEVRRVNKITPNCGLLIEMKMLNDNSEVSSHLSFLDSGSDVTLVSFDLAAALNLKLNPSKDLVHVGNSSELQVNYESCVKLVNGDEVFDVKVGILSTELMLGINYAHVLIGNDVLRLCRWHAVDYGAMVVQLGQVKYYAILATKENAPEIKVVAKRYLRVNQSIAFNEVKNFMTKHELAFTQDSSDLGTLPYEVVDLNFKKDVSFPKICRYTNPPHVKAAIDVEVNNLIANGALEKCNTPKFISNLIVSIRKKDSKKRVCADLRSLNSCIERIPTYLASPETVIAELSNAKWFAKLDLCSGYHHIKLAPEIRDYFAMFTSKGLYRFTRLSFGFVNSTVYFQYGMNAELSDVYEKWYRCATKGMLADPKKEYFLEVDSSLVGMGAVLMQMNDTGKLQPVSYYSKRFDPTIKASSVSALELRGIIFALRHYRHVVNRVTIITDHKPLIGFIQHGKSPELFKYLAFIESPGIELKYQNGKLMYGSDALSRQYNRFKKTGMKELTESGHRDNKLSLEDEKKLLDQLHNVLCHLGSTKATNLLKKYNDEIPDVVKKYKDICDRCSTC